MSGAVVGERAPGVRTLNWAEVDAESAPDLVVSGHGRILVLWPAPVDHDECFARAGFLDFADTTDAWHAGFADLVAALCRFLGRGGHARLVSGDYPRAHGIGHTLARLLGHPSAIATPENAIIAAALDDNFSPCVVHFGEPARAALRSGGGHPLLWTWSPRDGFDGVDLLRSVAGSLPS